MSYEMSVVLGSLYIEAQGCVPVLLENLHGMSCSGTCWLLGGGWFQCRYGGIWWAPIDYCSLESRVLWCSQDLDLSLLLLVFSLIFTVVSRLLFLYRNVDKTSRLKMKSFFTVRDTQRGSQSYMEKRRGRRELEVSKMRWGGIKRGESKLASNHFLICTSQLDCSEMFTELYREEKRERGDRGVQGDKRWGWNGERQIQPVISSLSVLHCLEPAEIHRVG